MDFLDEKIMEMRRQEKQKELNIREDGLIVKGEKIEFQDTTLFQEKMLILLPTSFVDMPQKIARLKYPSEQRPQIIKTDLLGSTNFAFNLFDKAMSRRSYQSRSYCWTQKTGTSRPIISLSFLTWTAYLREASYLRMAVI